MRLRLPELFEQRDPPTSAYAVVQAAAGRIHPDALYRLTRAKGRAKQLDLELAQALCDVLGVTPAELFESQPGDPPPHAPAPRKRARKAKG